MKHIAQSMMCRVIFATIDREGTYSALHERGICGCIVANGDIMVRCAFTHQNCAVPVRVTFRECHHTNLTLLLSRCDLWAR